MSKHFDNGHKDPFKVKDNRSIDDMIAYRVPDYDDDDDHHKKKNHDNNNNNRHDQNGKQHGNQNGNQNNQNNGNQNNQNNGPKWTNPVCKILRNDGRFYDRDDTLNFLIHKDGLVQMIKDLKSARKKPGSQEAAYVQKLLADITFASAIPEALEEVFGRKYDNEEIFSHKELGYLMNEILIFLNNSFKQNMSNLYDTDTMNKIRDVYTDILSNYSKKKIKKLCEEVKNMSKDTAKQICIITAGGSNPASSIYFLLNYFYREADKDGFFSVSVKSLTKLFKICYGKDNMSNVVKYLMLEKAKNVTNMTEAAVNVYVNIDLVIRDHLESLEKNDLYEVIKDFVGERKRQERNGYIARRFNKNDINPTDYPKLMKALSNIETKDFSIISYLKR